MRAFGIAIAVAAVLSLAARGQEPARGGSRVLPLRSDELTQDVPVRLAAGGRAYSAVAPASVGYTLFTNVAVDVDRYPIAQIEVTGTKTRWWGHVGRHGGSLSNLCSAPGAGQEVVNLFGRLGWKGLVQMDVLVQLKEDISVVRFDLGSAAEKDLVFEADAGAAASRFGESESSLQCFVESGHKHKGVKANGLPPDRLLPSTDPELGSYSLLPYNGLNAVELSTLREAPAESHVIDVPNFHYSKIGILGTSQGGDASFTLILTYDDGTSTTNWFEADDWYTRSRGCPAVATNMDRAIFTDGAIEDSNHFNLYEFVFQGLDPARTLDTVTLGNDPHRWPDSENRFTAVFAVNGRARVLDSRPPAAP